MDATLLLSKQGLHLDHRQAEPPREPPHEQDRFLGFRGNLFFLSIEPHSLLFLFRHSETTEECKRRVDVMPRSIPLVYKRFVRIEAVLISLALPVASAFLNSLPLSARQDSRRPAHSLLHSASFQPKIFQTCLRMCTEGTDGEVGADKDSFPSFLKQNILYPSNYNENIMSFHIDTPGSNQEESKDGDDDVVSVPINGESVAVAKIRPKMAMVYTCKNCETRQMKQFSKLAYEKGIVIIKCKGCEKHHLIADNLGWYKDWLGNGNSNIEELMNDRGEEAKRVYGEDAASVYEEWNEDTVVEN